MKVIRWKFVLPVFIFVVALVVFFVVFFDPLLARAVEVVGSKVNGAKVEVSGLKTKFFKGRLDIARLQVTNRNEPMKNIVDAGPLAFQLNPFELIKKRVVIPEAALEGLTFNTDRTSSGALPRLAKKEDEKDEKPSAAARLAEKYKDRFKVSLEGMKGDVKEKIKFDPKDLELTRQADALKGKTDALPEAWKTKVEGLSVEERLKKVEGDLNAIKNTPTQGAEAVTAIPAALKKLKETKQELDKIKSDVQTTKDAFGGEIKGLKGELKGLSAAKAKDIDGLLSRLNLDFADPQRLMEGFIGGAAMERFTTGLKYVEMARRHMPSKKEKEEMPARPRAKGMDVEFPRPADPPRFWLKEASLSGSFQDVAASGVLTHVTTDPPRVGKPLRLDLKGQKGAQKFTGEAVLDHVGEVSKDSFVLQASGFDLKEIGAGGMLGEALAQGSGTAEFALNAIGETQIGGHLRASLSGLKFDDAVLLQQVGVDKAASLSREDTLKADFVKNVARSIEKMPSVSLEAKLFGTWNDPDIKIASNLTSTFANVIKESIGNAVKNQRQQLEAELDNIYKTKSSEIEGTIAGLQSQGGGKLGGLDEKVQQKIKEAAGINLGGGEGGSPIPGLKVPSLDKLFKK